MAGICQFILAQQEAERIENFLTARDECNAQYRKDGDTYAVACCLLDAMEVQSRSRDASTLEYYDCLDNPCQADYTQDGVVNVDDLLVVINDFALAGGIDAILLIVEHWGAC